jgi:hypothetical protein
MLELRRRNLLLIQAQALKHVWRMLELMGQLSLPADEVVHHVSAKYPACASGGNGADVIKAAYNKGKQLLWLCALLFCL